MENLLCVYMNERCDACCADDKLPNAVSNPEYFADNRSSSKSPPRNDYYNNSAAVGVSRTPSRFINESRV